MRHTRQGKNLQIAHQKAEDYAEELRDALDKETVKDGHLEALQSTLKDVEAELRINEGSYKDCVTAIEAVMQKLKGIRQEIASKDEVLSSLHQNLHAAQQAEFHVTDRRQQIIRDKNAVVRKIANLNQEKARLSHRREQVVKRVIEYSEKAGLVSPRVPVGEGETPDSLDNKLERSDRSLRVLNEQ